MVLEAKVLAEGCRGPEMRPMYYLWSCNEILFDIYWKSRIHSFPYGGAGPLVVVFSYLFP